MGPPPGRTQKFLKWGFNFSKTNPNPIVANLFQPLIKMHVIIVKQGFAVIVAFCYICLFRNPVTTILKVAGCEDCVQENKLPLWGPLLGNSSNFFEKKIAILMPYR